MPQPEARGVPLTAYRRQRGSEDVVLFARLCTFVQGIEKNWVTREKRSCKRAAAPVYCGYPMSPEAEASALELESGGEQRMKQVVLAVVAAAALAASSAWGISVDSAITYNISGGTISGYSMVGLPFTVNQPINVGALGGFDYLGTAGLQSTSLTVSIRKWDPAYPSVFFVDPDLSLGPTVVSATLTTSSPAYGGSVWRYLQNSVLLNPGSYMLVASGFTTGVSSSDPAVLLAATNVSYNTFGGRVTYGAGPLSGFYAMAVGNSGDFTGWQFSSATPSFIAGGSFAVPEPSTYALMGTVGLALYLLRRRKKAAER